MKLDFKDDFCRESLIDKKFKSIKKTVRMFEKKANW